MVVKKLKDQLEEKGKEVNQFREKHNIRIRGEGEGDSGPQKEESADNSSTQGILVAWMCISLLCVCVLIIGKRKMWIIFHKLHIEEVLLLSGKQNHVQTCTLSLILTTIQLIVKYIRSMCLQTTECIKRIMLVWDLIESDTWHWLVSVTWAGYSHSVCQFLLCPVSPDLGENP